MENFSFKKIAEELDSLANGVKIETKMAIWDTAEKIQPVIDEMNKCQKLSFLSLEGNSLGVEGAKAIGRALENRPEFEKALWKDLFTGRLKDEIPIALKEMGNGIVKAGAKLKVLDCSDNALGPNGTAGLVDLLKSPACYSLEELYLNNCGLGVQGGEMVVNALLDCHAASIKAGTPLQLKKFIAGRNRLENSGAKALSKLFSAVKTLEHVELTQNGIYHIGVTALSNAFEQNVNLRILNLNDNTIGEDGATSLATALKSLQKLKQINFGDCLLQNNGAILLAEALHEGHNDLESLILEANEINVDGGIEIASAMVRKPNLKFLNLENNQFGEEGCIAIKEILLANNKIEYLCNDEEVAEEEEDEEENSESEQNAEENYENDCEDELHVEIDPLQLLEQENKVCGAEDLAEDNFEINYIAEFQKAKNATEDSNSHDDSSVIFVSKEELPDTIERFVDASFVSIKMFNALKETNKLEAFREYLKQFEKDEYLIKLTFLVLKCSHISEESEEALDIAVKLYKDCFDYATKSNDISRVRSFFLIQLGLLKSEDKTFRVKYKTNACRNVAKVAIQNKSFPEDVENSFKLFLERFS